MKIVEHLFYFESLGNIIQCWKGIPLLVLTEGLQPFTPDTLLRTCNTQCALLKHSFYFSQIRFTLQSCKPWWKTRKNKTRRRRRRRRHPSSPRKFEHIFQKLCWNISMYNGRETQHLSTCMSGGLKRGPSSLTSHLWTEGSLLPSHCPRVANSGCGNFWRFGRWSLDRNSSSPLSKGDFFSQGNYSLSIYSIQGNHSVWFWRSVVILKISRPYLEVEVFR